MCEERRKYPLTIHFNARRFERVEIDPHYEENHPDMTDQIILELVKLLDGRASERIEEDSQGFFYCARELYWHGKPYRIVLTYTDENFLGVVNAFRVKEKKS
jgi:hypothetical protein